MAKELNWIERGAKRERMLSQHGTDVWESVRTAIDNCVKSAEECYGDKVAVSKTTKNGHRLRVSVAHRINGLRKTVSVEFEQGKEIVVTQDGGSANRFHIMADEEHAFLSYQHQEITPDRFTELALEDALFKTPQIKSLSYYPPSEGGIFS